MKTWILLAAFFLAPFTASAQEGNKPDQFWYGSGWVSGRLPQIQLEEKPDILGRFAVPDDSPRFLTNGYFEVKRDGYTIWEQSHFTDPYEEADKKKVTPCYLVIEAHRENAELIALQKKIKKLQRGLAVARIIIMNEARPGGFTYFQSSSRLPGGGYLEVTTPSPPYVDINGDLQPGESGKIVDMGASE